MHLDGQALAADEPDHHHHRPPGIASVHTRAVITWVAIYPLAALGMSLMGALTPSWPAAARALVLTLIVVPLTVYLTVPALLLGVLTFRRRRTPRTDAQPNLLTGPLNTPSTTGEVS